MRTHDLDLSLTTTDPVGSDDDLTDDIPSRPRLLLPFWVYAHARARVSRGEFRDIRELFQIAIADFLVHLAEVDEFQPRGIRAERTLQELGIPLPQAVRNEPPTAPQAEEESPPFPLDSDRTDDGESFAREAVEEWVAELIDGGADVDGEQTPGDGVSHAKPGRRGLQ